jgi:hypothetical protein
MQLFAYFVIGVLATWLLTWSMITQDVEGPFRVYQGIRWVIKTYFPPFVSSNLGCPICVSFWAGALVALFLPVYAGLGWLQSAALYFVITYALSGATVFWYRYIKSVYGIGSDTF